MEVDAVKRFGRLGLPLLLLLLINLGLLAFFPSPSVAAGGRFGLNTYDNYYNNQLAAGEEHQGGAVASFEEVVHERVLKANTRDYGRYDATPALSKPPFKLIPN